MNCCKMMFATFCDAVENTGIVTDVDEFEPVVAAPLELLDNEVEFKVHDWGGSPVSGRATGLSAAQ